MLTYGCRYLELLQVRSYRGWVARESSLADQICQMMESALQFDPTGRPSAREIFLVLEGLSDSSRSNVYNDSSSNRGANISAYEERQRRGLRGQPASLRPPLPKNDTYLSSKL